MSHSALRELQYWRGLRQTLNHRPIWPKLQVPSLKVHTDASMSAYGATLRNGDHEASSRAGHESSSRAHFEFQDHWTGECRLHAHITVLKLLTARLTLQEFAAHCLLQHGDKILLLTNNMVAMHTASAMVPNSPPLMIELRRLHAFLRY